MSLTAFKRKSVINYGSKRSGTAPGGYWLPQGPFGHATTALSIAIKHPNNSGFSINGGHRNIGGVGRDMKMSKSGTPFRGLYPIGYGGTKGSYPSGSPNPSSWGGHPTSYESSTLVGSVKDGIQSTGSIANFGNKGQIVEPLLNARVVDTMGTQYLYIKPSVVSTYGLLQKKYKWAYYGQYPNYWVQPNYTGNQSDTKSQQLYIQNKAAANTCNLKVNDVGTYEGHNIKCGPTLCTPGRSTARFKYNDMARNAPYTKILYQPVSYTQYNQYISRGCVNPVGKQKPFPYATSVGSSHAAAGTSITNFGTGCGSTPIYLSPPEWYTSVKPSQVPQQIKDKPQTTHFNYYIDVSKAEVPSSYEGGSLPDGAYFNMV